MRFYNAIATGFLVLGAGACVAHESDDGKRFETLLQSTDSAAVYNAGVQAYRSKRYETARALWRRAADLSDHEAESNLGFLLYYGHGGPPDSLLASEYWRRAMAAQDAEAHRHVAQAILDGDTRLGPPLDAHSHAVAARTIAGQPGALAGDQVSRDAKRLLDSLKAYLPRSQVEAAERLGTKWASAHGYP